MRAIRQMAMIRQGVVAAGHPKTAQVAQRILAAGGNAFDAVLAAHLAACVTEPVFTSLGGGGFLLAHTADGRDRLYDFFAHTPIRRRCREELEFYPIVADFGTATQEFHIGMGAIATPGFVKGLFRIHRELCSLPMAAIAEPAIALARQGVRVNVLQRYAFEVVSKIYQAHPTARRIYASRVVPSDLVHRGELLRLPQLAETIETLARAGERWFYHGEIARCIARNSREAGGHLTELDLSRYRVIVRKPLGLDYRGARLLLNPLPSCGGSLIGFALKLLETAGLGSMAFGSAEHLALLVRAMELTSCGRTESGIDDLARGRSARGLLGARYLRRYRAAMREHAGSHCGTTHVSVIDRRGNMASMTSSNGEGCGYIVPDTGIMLNNMLGEEDLNPYGFQRWPQDRRLASMMSPSLLFDAGGRAVALGSGGSNRIRTALLQVLSNLLDFHMPLKRAIASPRVHLEQELLHAEEGYETAALIAAGHACRALQCWDHRNLFFGGVHGVQYDTRSRRFAGVGDPRRGGAALIALA
jgi:gamma-glutamyltranspeptidase/glutathione hydrolase